MKSLVYNLEKDNSQKKIANKDLNLLKYKVESLQKNYWSNHLTSLFYKPQSKCNHNR